MGHPHTTSLRNLFQHLTTLIVKKLPPYVHSKSILFQFKTATPCPVTKSLSVRRKKYSDILSEYPQVLLCRAVLNPFNTQSVPILVIAPTLHLDLKNGRNVSKEI